MEYQSLGIDVIFEILSRTPLQTLRRCRLVSRECNDLTYESYFARLHAQRTGTVSGFFLQTITSNKYSSEFVSVNRNLGSKLSLDFLPVSHFMILACTNQGGGLLLCVNKMPRFYRIPEYYMCKPSNKEWQRIPNPKTRYFTQRTAMLVVGLNPFRYRILRLSDPNQFRKPNRKHANECSFRCEIFDSEAWSWKQLEEIYLPYDVVLSHQAAVSVCGVFHWLTSANNIFAFHAGNETWRMLPLPDGINSEMYLLKLSEYEGKLALVSVERGRDDCFELWVMEEYYRAKEWRRRHTVSTKPLQREEPYVTPSPEALCNADVAMMSSYNKVYFYKFMDGSSVAVKLENFFDSHGVFCFESDV